MLGKFRPSGWYNTTNTNIYQLMNDDLWAEAKRLQTAWQRTWSRSGEEGGKARRGGRQTWANKTTLMESGDVVSLWLGSTSLKHNLNFKTLCMSVLGCITLDCGEEHWVHFGFFQQIRLFRNSICIEPRWWKTVRYNLFCLSKVTPKLYDLWISCTIISLLNENGKGIMEILKVWTWF